MYVIRNRDGHFLEVGPVWKRAWTPDLQKARTYPTTAAARNSANQTGKYGRRVDPVDYDVVPVRLFLLVREA